MIFALFLSGLLTAALPKPLLDLQKTFHAKKGFEVEFSQEVKQSPFPEKPGQSNSIATGKVSFTRPHSLKWTYEKPKPRTITYDGKKLVVGDEEVHGSDAMNLEESFSFLWGETNSTFFKVESLSAKEFRLTPKQTNKASYKYIDVEVVGGKVESAKVQSVIEGSSELRFKNWKIY